MHVEYKKSFFCCRRKWKFSMAYKSNDFLSLIFGLDLFCRLFNSSRIPWCLIWKEQKWKYLRNFASTCQFTNVYVKLFFNMWKYYTRILSFSVVNLAYVFNILSITRITKVWVHKYVGGHLAFGWKKCSCSFSISNKFFTKWQLAYYV